jgi:hypothetical protein
MDCASDPECQARLRQAADASCGAFEPPVYVIRGATPYDQKWATNNTEAGIGACNWPRPQPRPPELDAKAPPVAPKAEPSKRAPRVSLGTRIKRAIIPQATAAPAPPPAAVVSWPPPNVEILRTVPTAAAEPAAAPPKPRDPRDELLGAK